MKKLIYVMLFLFITSGIYSSDVKAMDDIELCKYTIAIVMGRNPTQMTGYIRSDGHPHVEYIRKSDGIKWTYKCMIDNRGNTGFVNWAAPNGRWRDSIRYTIKDNQITMVEMEYGVIKTYNINN